MNITDNIIKFKVSEDYDAIETSYADTNVYFPFSNERSTFSRYRAQLFYAPSNTISSVSIAVAKGGDFPQYNLPIGIYKYENDPDTNYGIDNTSNVIIAYNTPSAITIASDSIETVEDNSRHLPMVTVDGLSITVVKGTAYWLVLDCGKVYDNNLGANRTHDFYFTVTSGGWTAVGADQVSGSYYLATVNQGLTINTAPIRSDIAPWNFTDFPRDHVFMINGVSPVQVAFSLDNISYVSEYLDLYSEANEWQVVGYTMLSLTDASIGGISEYGSKTVYTRFRRYSAADYTYSVPIQSTILYTPGIPVINEVLLSYIGTS